MLVNLLFIMQKCKKIHKIGKILLDFTASRVYYIYRNKNTEPTGRNKQLKISETKDNDSLKNEKG